MEVLNEALRFEDLPADDRAAFLGTPTRLLIKAGQRLLRFATDGQSHALGAWWITQQTYELLTLRAERLGTSVEVLARSKLAVQHEWNTRMNRLYIGTLFCDVYGFEGLAIYQRLFRENSKVLLPGNFSQVWVGNLSPGQIRIAACDL
jgi:hypothetical protein